MLRSIAQPSKYGDIVISFILNTLGDPIVGR